MYTLLKIILGLLLFLVGTPLLVWALGFLLFTGSVAGMDAPHDIQNADAAIVLTGGSNRVSAGLDLLAQGKIRNLLISGVHKNATRREVIKEAGYEKKLPDCCITLGHEAENTIGNAQEAHKWLTQHETATVYIVTSNYHMPRAMMEFRHALPNMTLLSYPVKPIDFDPQERGFWKLMFLEYHKFLMTAVRIKIFPQATTPMPEELTQ